MSHSVFSPIASLFHFETIAHLQTVFRDARRNDSHVDTSWRRTLYCLDKQNLSSVVLVVTRWEFWASTSILPFCKYWLSATMQGSYQYLYQCILWVCLCTTNWPSQKNILQVKKERICPHLVRCLSFLCGRWRERDTLGMTSLPSCSRKGMTPRRPSNRRWSGRTSPVSFAWLTGRLRDVKWCDCVSISVCVSLDSPSRYFCIS